MVVALLGVLKAGAAYLPLDPQHPVERLAFMLADAEPALVLSDCNIAKSLPLMVEILRLDEPEFQAELERSGIANPTDDKRKSPLLPHHAAYVIYTSGSTGTPRGCVPVTVH